MKGKAPQEKLSTIKLFEVSSSIGCESWNYKLVQVKSKRLFGNLRQILWANRENRCKLSIVKPATPVTHASPIVGLGWDKRVKQTQRCIMIQQDKLNQQGCVHVSGKVHIQIRWMGPSMAWQSCSQFCEEKIGIVPDLFFQFFLGLLYSW